jgi:hypothetical protein
MKDITITLSKGGTAEKKVKLSQLVIPDIFTYDKTPSGKAINEVWHIAHDLKRELEERSKK